MSGIEGSARNPRSDGRGLILLDYALRETVYRAIHYQRRLRLARRMKARFYAASQAPSLSLYHHKLRWGSAEVIDQRASGLQINGLEPLAEPTVDRREKFISASGPALLVPELG